MPEMVRTAEGAVAAAGLSINEFCKLISVHRATWQRWKAGKSAPDVPVWLRVTATLHDLGPLGPAAANAVALGVTDTGKAA